MSETQAENTPTQASETASQEQPSSDQTFTIGFRKAETGRTHTVVTNGVQQTVPLTHGETGEPETEYVLYATIGGVDVPLATYNSGRIDTLVGIGQRQQQSAQQV